MFVMLCSVSQENHSLERFPQSLKNCAIFHAGQHRAAVAACERSGGLAIALQRRHADLAALTKRQQAATAA